MYRKGKRRRVEKKVKVFVVNPAHKKKSLSGIDDIEEELRSIKAELNRLQGEVRRSAMQNTQLDNDLVKAKNSFRENIVIRKPKDAEPLVRPLSEKKQEYLQCISLDMVGKVIACRTITIGLVNRTLAHPREIFAEAISDRASEIIVAHNHPHGDPQPSAEDIAFTKSLVNAGEIIRIPVFDHMIIGKMGYVSFREAGMLH